jgi:hypothetical protein
MRIRLFGSNQIGGVIYPDGAVVAVADEIGENLIANVLAEIIQPEPQPDPIVHQPEPQPEEKVEITPKKRSAKND